MIPNVTPHAAAETASACAGVNFHVSCPGPTECSTNAATVRGGFVTGGSSTDSHHGSCGTSSSSHANFGSSVTAGATTNGATCTSSSSSSSSLSSDTSFGSGKFGCSSSSHSP